MLNATKSSKRITNVESMFEIHCFLQIMLMQANFGNLQGVFPVPICKILTCTLDKKFPGTETHFETWDIFWADKGRKGNGVETRTFNSFYGGNSTSSSRVSRKGIRASLVFSLKGMSNCIN